MAPGHECRRSRHPLSCPRTFMGPFQHLAKNTFSWETIDINLVTC